MKGLTLLLTGAGGVALPSLAKHLHDKGCRVLMADMDRYAAGLSCGDKGFVIPPGDSPEFALAIRHICETESVNVLVPLVDEELLPSQTLQSDSLHVLTPRREFVELCLDKFALMQRLAQEGISTPRTMLVSSASTTIDQPMILKPRRGRGSRGVVRVQSSAELAEALRRSSYSPSDLLLQEYIDGPEFTVSVVVWRDGEVQAVVPKQILAKHGVTQLAITRRHAQIDNLCRRIQMALRGDGPFNVQLRLHPSTGEPLPFEINPRFSTSVSLTMAAGIDEVYGLSVQAVHGRGAYSFGLWKEGVVLQRRSLDIFMDEKTFQHQRSKICYLR